MIFRLIDLKVLFAVTRHPQEYQKISVSLVAAA